MPRAAYTRATRTVDARVWLHARLESRGANACVSLSLEPWKKRISSEATTLGLFSGMKCHASLCAGLATSTCGTPASSPSMTEEDDKGGGRFLTELFDCAITSRPVLCADEFKDA
jgi:hypothetical protein